jgi:hypothetical protein
VCDGEGSPGKAPQDAAADPRLQARGSLCRLAEQPQHPCKLPEPICGCFPFLTQPFGSPHSYARLADSPAIRPRLPRFPRETRRQAHRGQRRQATPDWAWAMGFC